MAIVAAAMSCGHSVWYWNRNWATPIWTVHSSEPPCPSSRFAQKNSFQMPWKVRIDDGRHRGRRERQHHAPVRLEVARAVELRRLLVVLRDRQEVLPHEEQVRGERDARPEEDVPVPRLREVPVGDREVDHHQVHGHEPELVGDHQRAEHDEEEDLAQREPQSRERVAAERPQEHVERGDRRGQDQAVLEEGDEGQVLAGPDLPVGREARVRPATDRTPQPPPPASSAR